MPRGNHKRWDRQASFAQAKQKLDQGRFVNPWPQGASPNKEDQHRGAEYVATVTQRAGQGSTGQVGVSDYWSIKGEPFNQGKDWTSADGGRKPAGRRNAY